jgi:hypothetical protein
LGENHTCSGWMEFSNQLLLKKCQLSTHLRFSRNHLIKQFTLPCFSSIIWFLGDILYFHKIKDKKHWADLNTTDDNTGLNESFSAPTAECTCRNIIFLFLKFLWTTYLFIIIFWLCLFKMQLKINYWIMWAYSVGFGVVFSYCLL